MPDPEYRVFYPDEILQSLQQIRDYIAKDSDERAAAMLARLVDAMDGLAEKPGRYAEVEYATIPFPVRRMIVKPYRILFRLDEARKAVWIVRVEHGSRDTR
jgi:toxin ParE1/3/4